MRLMLLGGSLRPESLNRRLLRHVAEGLVAWGHEVAVFKGEALRLPLYEEGLFPTAETRALHEALGGVQGLVIVSPEYNAGIPGHLKNAVDWLSTMKPSPWTGLPVLLCAASPGAFGGARALITWRTTRPTWALWPFPRRSRCPMRISNWTRTGPPPTPAPQLARRES